MIINIHGKHEITPTLMTMISQSHIDSLCCSNGLNGSSKSVGRADAADEINITQDGNLSSCSGKASCSDGSETYIINDCLIFEDTNLIYHEVLVLTLLDVI